MAFIESGVKENLNTFKNAECLRVFDEAFAMERDQRMLWRIGFTPEQISYLMNECAKRDQRLRQKPELLRRSKSQKGN